LIELPRQCNFVRLEYFPIIGADGVMAWTIRDDLRLAIKMGLLKGLRRIRGLRRLLTDEEQNRIADAIADQLAMANLEVSAGKSLSGHGRSSAGRAHESGGKNSAAANPGDSGRP
jgi:hypothetical protein